MRNPVRKLMGVAMVGVLGALFAMPMLAAGAVDPTLPIASDCSFTVTGTFPNFVVAGTAPTDTTVTLYFQPDAGGVDGPVATQPGPAFSFNFVAPGPGNISVGYVTSAGNAYAATCSSVGGIVVVHVQAEAVQVIRPGAALAFTGSNDTPSYVLVGIAALVLGAVLVVAARRRSQVS